MKQAFSMALLGVALGAIAASDRTEAAEQGAFGSVLVRVAQASPGGLDRPVSAGSESSDTDRYGSLATGMPYDYELRLGPKTKRIAVWRLQTIRFVTAEGRQFTWRFDGVRSMDEFPLAAIAPADIVVPAGATVSLNGEIPISP